MRWDRNPLKGLNPAKALAVKLVSPAEAAVAAIVHGGRPGWGPPGNNGRLLTINGRPVSVNGRLISFGGLT